MLYVRNHIILISGRQFYECSFIYGTKENNSYSMIFGCAFIMNLSTVYFLIKGKSRSS